MNIRADDDGSFAALLGEIAGAPAIPLEADEEVLPAGTVVDGSFEIDKRLGAGGMGVVYQARDTRLGREVALKVMRLDRWRRARREGLLSVFEREAQATARLNHANVVTLHHYGTWEGAIYLVLELLRGRTLAERLAAGPMPLDDALDVAEQILAALEHAHGLGVVHRDLKPQNVFLADDGRVKVLDFGLAGLAQAREGETPAAALATFLSRAGTPAYMAPEQWRGEAQDARTDLWQTGAVLFQLITGTLPHGDARSDQAKKVPSVRGDAPGAPRALDELVARLLAPDPAARPACASDVLVELARIRRPRGRTWRRALLVAAAGVALAGGGALVWRAERPAAPAIDLAGTWAYVPEGRAGVTITRLGGDRYLFEYTDAAPGEAPSPERFRIRGELHLARRGGKLVMAGDVVDVPGWGKGQVGTMSFDVLAGDRLMMTRSEWGKTRDHYTFAYPPWLLVRVTAR